MLLVRPLQTRSCLRIARHASARFYASASSSPKIVFSGIQPTGVPHLGNYLGALQQWVELQNASSAVTDQDTTLLYSLVDLHAITIKQDPQHLSRWRKESLATLLAIGLDPKRSILFYQSDVPQHAELMWILSCYASMGYLSRMTQWKSKLALPDTADPLDTSTNSSPALRLGLFSYPVLQAADILLYGATHVPVGADQAQHLEFTREVANSFNHIHGAVLHEPETVLSQSKRVMSLTHPDKKMSKSHKDPKSRIVLTDSKATIKKKFRSALTDSEPGPLTYDPIKRPGVSNLLDILFYTERGAPHTVEELAKDCENLSLKDLKDRTADAVESRVEPIRTRLESILGETGNTELEQVAEEGRVKARRLAENTLTRVKDAIGIS